MSLSSPRPVAKVPNHSVRGGIIRAADRLVPEETPVALTYGRQTYAVMLASPCDLEDFAVGFSLAEGIITKAQDIEALDIVVGELGIELRIDLRGENMINLENRRRRLTGATGCGMCGLESLAEVERSLPRVESARNWTLGEIVSAMAALEPAQIINRQTRAVHAAGFWTPQEGLVALREDIGRHNALDKLAGALARQSRVAVDGAIVLTSRVSLEMVQKTARLGAGLLVALSAPTALAVRTAQACGLTLVAIARGEEFEIFTHPARISPQRARHAG